MKYKIIILYLKMEKYFPVYIDDVPSFKMAITKKNKIGEIKNSLKEYKNYDIKLFINSKNSLEVFETDKYDKMTLESVWNQIKDPHITLKKVLGKEKEISQEKVLGKEKDEKMEKIERFTGNKDVDMKILLELKYKDLMNTCRVNSYISKLCKNDNLWRNKLQKDFPLRSKLLWYEEYKKLYYSDPKKLYEIINSPSKIVTIHKEDFPSIKERFTENNMEIENEELDYLTEKNLQGLHSLPLLRGDVISLEWLAGYRNNGKLMWDGEKLVQLNYEADDYGSASLLFTFPEFSPDHFFESIDHNEIVNFSEEKIKEIERNFDPETQYSYVTDNYNDTYSVRILFSVDGVNINFNKIFIENENTLEYNSKNKSFDLYIPIKGGGSGNRTQVTRTYNFTPEWKNAISSIEPMDPSTTYSWKGNILEVVMKRDF